jgi:hypothetical protein
MQNCGYSSMKELKLFEVAFVNLLSLVTNNVFQQVNGLTYFDVFSLDELYSMVD